MEHLAGQYFLNSDLRAEEIREQIQMLCSAGYESIFLHARAGLKTPYFSKQWFEALETAVDELIKNNAKFAIWDEDNYPSGDAGNRICNSFPELAASCLNFRVIEAEKDTPILEYFSVNGAFCGCFAVYPNGEISDISDHCGTLRSKWNPAFINITAYSPFGQLPLPHRRRSMDTPRFALSWTPDKKCKIVTFEILRSSPGRHCSDLLNAETTQVLLDIIHAEYERRFGQKMKYCSASFMDEPSPAGIYPWTRSLPEEFFKDHNCELLPNLPHLVMDITPASPCIRNDYRKTLHRLLCQNYLEPVKKWLNERNIASAGHLTRSEYLSWSGHLWPNELRCFKHFDIPCCDPLGAGTGKPGSIAHHIGIKAVSSAARLFKKRAAGADAFAVGGDTISLRDLKFMLNYHLVMGITWFNVHGLYYTLDGERRDEAPPSLFYQHSQWPHMKTFLSYLKQRCAELDGEHQTNLAFLYPSSALQCRLPASPAPDEKLHKTAEALLSQQRDFELIDEETLSEQTPADFAVLRPYFIVAHAAFIEKKTAVWLEKYVSCGGQLFVAGVTPELIVSPGTVSKEIWSFSEKYKNEDFITAIPAPDIQGEQKENILIRKIRQNNNTRLFLFNRGKKTFCGTCDGKCIELAPGVAGFAEELQKKDMPPVLPISDLNVSFGLDSVPVNRWNTYCGPQIDILEKASLNMEKFAEFRRFSATFSVEDAFPLLFTTEEETLLRGSFELNGIPLTEYRKADFRDCREVECDITSLVKTGRNILTFNGGLFENPPYLRGNFTVEFPLGNSGYPTLSAAEKKIFLSAPCDYRYLGYGTFSGTAVYEGKVRAPQNGSYTLEFALIHDSVKVTVDGKELQTLIAPPYKLEVALSAGEHFIALEVCNAPGNRDILAGLPAGLQR